MFRLFLLLSYAGVGASPPAPAALPGPAPPGAAASCDPFPGLLAGRAVAREAFDDFVTCAIISPHFALIGMRLDLRLWNFTALRATFAGARGEVPQFSWPLALLLPGVHLARYPLMFLRNPADSLMAVFFILVFVAQDVVLYVTLVEWVRGKGRRGALSRFIARPLIALVSLTFRWAVVKALWAVARVGLLRGGAADWVHTLVLDAMGLATVCCSVKFLQHLFLTWRHGAHHHEANEKHWSAVHNLISELQTDQDLYANQNAKWDSLYELVPPGSRYAPPGFSGFDAPGGHTRLELGRNRKTGDLVVIKAIKLSMPRPMVEMMVTTALRCVKDTTTNLARGRLEESAEQLSDRLAQLVELVKTRVVERHDRASRLMCDHEVRALRSAQVVRQGHGVVHFHSAHLCKGDVFPAGAGAVPADPHQTSSVIVTAYVGRSWKVRPPVAPRTVLLALRSAARTLAKLHSAGIAHRDIKLANFASPEEDLTKAVLLDMGIAALQNPSDIILYYRTSKWSPPESSRPGASSEIEMCFKGDVWTFGLLTVKLFVGPNVQLKELLRTAGVEGDSASAGSWTEGSAAALVGRCVFVRLVKRPPPPPS